MNRDGWEIRLCGPLSVACDGRSLEGALPGRQGRALLAYLVVNRDRDCSRAELIDALWPENVPAAADSALSALLSKLRRALGDGVLNGRRELRLRLEGDVWVDAEAAEAAVAYAESALDARDPAAAAPPARTALELAAAPFLQGVEGHWVDEHRRELELVRVRALECLADAGLRHGGAELGAAEHAARAAIAVAPFRESSYRLLMEIHEAEGNQAEALRVFDELRRVLREELGTSPGPRVQAVYDRVLRGEAPPPRAGSPAAAARTDQQAPWPAGLGTARDRRAFVGRETELDALRAHWADALQGTRRFVLLAGEAGIGKTTVAAEAAADAHAEGASVLYGRCDEEATAPYQPIVEMLRGYAAGASLEPLRGPLGAHADELASLLPELGAPGTDASAGGFLRAELDAQRRRFFDALSALLAELGAARPLLLVFDDLHWADRPTVQLLRHLVRAPLPRQVLFLGTSRDGEELPDDHPLVELAGDLRRDGAFERLALPGLDETQAGALVAALSERDPPQHFVRALHAETEGNPFFIEEVVRHLRDAGADFEGEVQLADAGVPEGVREVTARRLRRLGAPAREALQIAAVIGREFDFELLTAVGAGAGDELVAALEEAMRARVIREVAGHVGRYAFTHALIRATLHDGVSALRRARLHGRVGEALLELHGPADEEQLAAVAHHFVQAAAIDQPERAVEFAIQAARRADRLLAWEEAADHYRSALRVREEAGERGDRLHCDLLLALGASQERAGRPEARDTFTAAADCARDLEDPELVARAALGVAGPWNILGEVRVDVVRLLEEALAGLGWEPSPLRARLLARLSFELYYAGDPSRRLALSERAVEIARRTRDLATLAACLDARHYALWRPETVEERLAVAAELCATAERIGDRELRLEGLGWTVVDLLELGDIGAVDRQIEAAAGLAEEVHQPLYLWWTSLFRGMRAQLAGDFAEAERLAHETLAIGQRGQAVNAVHYFAQQMFNIRREQGRLDEVEAGVRGLIEMYPAIPAWRGVLALLCVEMGRLDEAREAFDWLMGPGIDALPRDANWLIAVTLLAEVCGALSDAERARTLYAVLEPYAGRNVVVGRAATCNGSASRLLGILAATKRDFDAAERHFEDALAMHRSMGARSWTARTQLAWGEMLLARAGEGDGARARELLADAIVGADELGMVPLGERARALVVSGSAAEPAR